MTSLVRTLDASYTNLLLRDLWGRVYWGEDWIGMPSAQTYDFSWVDSSRPIRIAHALGAAHGPLQNSLEAGRHSIALGFRLLEVDIWLDPSGLLRCHHGPYDGRVSSSTPGTSECTAAQLLRALKDWPEAYLVPDIKTDFDITVRALLALAARENVARRVVLQLYGPGHLVSFGQWQAQYQLPGPIVTTYRSHLPIWRVQPSLESRGYRAIAMPLDAVPFIERAQPTTAMSQS